MLFQIAYLFIDRSVSAEVLVQKCLIHATEVGEYLIEWVKDDFE